MILTAIRSNSRFLALGNSADTAFSDADILACSNLHYHDLMALAVKAQGDWTLNDQTKLQRSITAATREYALPTTFLTVSRVEVKYPSTSDEYVAATPISESEIPPQGKDSYAPASPQYILRGSKIELFLPNKTADITAVTNGLNVYYNDEITALAATDSETVLPEFANRLLCLLNAKDYCGVNGLNSRLTWLVKEIGNENEGATKKYIDFLKGRAKDRRPSIDVRREDYGQSAQSGLTTF
jgi:hypothetical protein